MGSFVRTQEIEQRIGHGGRFALRVTSPEVHISSSDDDLARVRITMELQAGSDAEADELFERARFTVRQAEGLLEVSEPRHAESGLAAIARLFRGARWTDARVEVELPRGAEVECSGVSAELTARDLTGTQLYRTVSGDLVLDQVGGGIRIHAVSGDVSIRAAAPISLEANTVSGDISATAPRLASSRVVTVSGDVEMEGALDPSGSHRVETVSGDLALGAEGGLTLEVRGLSTDVHIDLQHRAEGSRDRRRYVIGDGASSLAFSSMSGDVRVRSPRRERRERRAASEGPSAPTPGSPVPATTMPDVATEPPGPSADEQLAILRAVERGELDVEEAARRLAGGPPGD